MFILLAFISQFYISKAFEARNSTRIFGGNKASTEIIRGFSHLLVTYYDINDRAMMYTCGGSLIHRRFVLTAAHCVYGGEQRNFASRVKISIGMDRPDPKQSHIIGVKIFLPKTFDKVSIIPDIALIKLSKEVPRNQATPIHLSHSLSDIPNVKRSVIAAGFGRIDERFNRRESPRFVMEAKMMRNSFQSCRNVKRITEGGSIDNMRADWICATSRDFQKKGGPSTCHGDSGGPVFVFKNGHYYQIGISTITWSTCGTRNCVNWIYLVVPIFKHIIRLFENGDDYYWESISSI